MMERGDDDFTAYLNELVRRDREGAPSEIVDLAAVRKAVNIEKPKPRQRDKVDRTWYYHQQSEHLASLLAWRFGSRRGQLVASALMREFGSLPAALSASRYRLTNVPGVGPKVIETLWSLRQLAERMALDSIENDKPILSSWTQLIDYLRIKTAYSDVEHFHALFLDKKNRLIIDEIQQSGTVDHVSVFPREIARRCLELGACAVLLCHNHPSGDPLPPPQM